MEQPFTIGSRLWIKSEYVIIHHWQFSSLVGIRMENCLSKVTSQTTRAIPYGNRE